MPSGCLVMVDGLMITASHMSGVFYSTIAHQGLGADPLFPPVDARLMLSYFLIDLVAGRMHGHNMWHAYSRTPPGPCPFRLLSCLVAFPRSLRTAHLNGRNVWETEMLSISARGPGMRYPVWDCGRWILNRYLTYTRCRLELPRAFRILYACPPSPCWARLLSHMG